MPLKIPYARVDWINSIFLSLIAILALVGAPIFLYLNGIDWFIANLFIFYVLATGLSITLGYHRLFSHLSFKARWPVRLFTLVFGACAFENSVLNWASDHRRHHKHTDHDDDPYNITHGFFWAHIGWILFKVLPEPPLDNVADLRRDPLVIWQHRFDKWIAVVLGLLLPGAAGWWWNGWEGALGGFLIVGALRVFVVQQCTFFINSLCHTIGRQPYSDQCSAKDSALMAFLTFGEGYHNFHHRFQHDYRNGVKVWAFDPTKWTIWCLEKIGLVSEMRRVPEHRILLAEMNEARKQAERRLSLMSSTGQRVCSKGVDAIALLQESLAVGCMDLEKAMEEKIDVSRQLLNRWRYETRELMKNVAALRALPA
jgi:stearoyl-CoA desaturase (delta-9 desaturase)